MSFRSGDIRLTSALPIFKEDKQSEEFSSGWDFEYETSTQEFTFRCFPGSKLLVLDPRPDESEMARIYPPEYLPYRFDSLPKIVVILRNLVQKSKVRVYEKLVKRHNARVLDLGCGNGQLLKLIKKYAPVTWSLWGSDFNELVGEHLKTYDINFIPGDIRNYSGAERFDLIILNQVVEHLPDVPGVLEKLKDLLSPGGVLILETPSSDGLDARLFRKRYWGGYHYPRHFYIFNEQNLSELVRSLDLVIESVDYMASPSFWIQSIHHLIKEKFSRRIASFFTTGNVFLLSLFSAFDILFRALGGKTSNMRLIARKR